ncbi:GMC family oxidoreductase N-terminal domain-containing protein [Acinetobacter baumannii]|uniref:GMC family oxidoreductase n=1 Tax=Acinetobacter baumannii TaxID=470 RepID=UPI00244D5133|nr:GMC family oxidoreductase N-terminal domain-containing protein [Acinetobacter baumannii]MDH2622538.1 GMC family oxidoreductase N-terminal domain-containing protein [Acinetobacter baumannii]
MQTVDYIVVGGGTTGCIVASKLAQANKEATVLLIEEGPADTSPWIKYPGTYYKTAQGDLLTRYPWESPKEFERESGDTMIQARVLGGGSSVNGMVYARGNPQDYDAWEKSGAEGWGYKDILPYYVRSEDNSDYVNEAHGIGGPLGISFPASIHPLTRKWLQACQQAGHSYNHDFNSGNAEGCGIYQIQVRNALRSSSASAYLHPTMKSCSNLKLLTDTKVLRIIIENGIAKGIEYSKNKEKKQVFANSEIIISSGTIGTPKLLMLSGIGDAEALTKLGIKVNADVKGVGKNFQDHLEMSQVYQLQNVESYDKYKKNKWKVVAALQYLISRTGPIATNLIEGGLFAKGSLTNEPADLQYFFIVGAGIEEGTDSVPGGTGCTLNFEHVRPKSRGFVELKSSNPDDYPRIVPNYMTNPYDLERLTEGYFIGQEIMKQSAFSSYVAKQHYPGIDFKDKKDLGRFLRKTARAALHPVGTCKMGSDEFAVVDSQLKVKGIDNLRVADASIMPFIVSGNTNAACTMIGERAADLILGKSKLPVANV